MRTPLALLLAAGLSTSAAAQGVAPLATAPSDEQKLMRCDASATANGLTGYRRGLFISECLEAKPSAAPQRKAGAPSRPPATTTATQAPKPQKRTVPAKPKPKPKPPELDDAPEEAPQ
jgi:hypothetical protein